MDGLAQAQEDLPQYIASRTTQAPKIDGKLDDAGWADIPVAGNFKQNIPLAGGPVGQESEVKIIYDDFAVYVGAFLFDSDPDSIAMELGSRDAEGLNSDYFRVVFDPYNLRQDGYVFQVYASGVQKDWRFSDDTFNAVWESAVSKNSKGWFAEFRIPYSAIRFPEKDFQEWAMQLARSIRRNFEYDQWALVPRNAPNAMNYFGTLNGIEHIKPPTRLSLTPYLSSYVSRNPVDGVSGQYENAFDIKYGADLKYGLDDRFTLDVSLLPDFGQAQSDNKVKNLGFQEVIYNENRTFFQEGVELFSLGNLFYTRRIGRVPRFFHSLPYMINPGDSILENPAKANLINAAKLSGRTDNGLGVGIFNAVTDNMFAVVQDSAGSKRKILTEPLTNYNILVFDQQLKNNSNLYLINTNVARGKKWDDANVTGVGTSLNSKNNKFSFDGEGSLSQKFYLQDTANGTNEVVPGYSYFLGLRKNGGNLNYGISHSVVQKNYNPRDLGFFTITDFSNYRGYISAVKNKPSWIFREGSVSMTANERTQKSTGKLSDLSFSIDGWGFLTNYFSVFAGAEISPVSLYDYNEPRIPDTYYRTAQYWVAWMGFGTDERKKIYAELNFSAANFFKNNFPGFPDIIGFFPSLRLRYRMNNRFSMLFNTNLNYDPYNGGFAAFDAAGSPVMGGRKVVTWVHNFTTKFVFNPKLSIQLTARHYWSHGEYKDYFYIGDNGMLSKIENYQDSHNFNYNAFNIDAILIWQFAPGSFLTLNYKNAIESENSGYISIPGFGENLSDTFQSPQANTISLKAIYFLDYLYLRKLKKHPEHKP